MCVWMVLEVGHLISSAYCKWELMSYPIVFTLEFHNSVIQLDRNFVEGCQSLEDASLACPCAGAVNADPFQQLIALRTNAFC